MRRTLFLIVWLFGLAHVRAADLDNETCLACHGQKGMDAPFVDVDAFSRSIHGKNLCASCHADIREVPHPPKLAMVSCSRCHRLESQIYLSSDHGKAVARGKQEAASCKDCHGHSHTLLNSRNPKSPVNRLNIEATCKRCHGDPKRMANVRLTERDPVVSYEHSIHGVAFAQGRTNAAVCSDCHGTHDLHRSQNAVSRVNRAHIPETCGRCHQNVAAVYQESVHGQARRAGIKEAPVCTDCHGEHTIRSPKDPSSSVFVSSVTKTCTACHASEKMNAKLGLPTDRLKTYFSSYHGLASRRGDLRVANCASCHGYHDVLPSTDPRSSVSPLNRGNTCGRCHPGAGQQLTKGFVHGEPFAKNSILKMVRQFYGLLIPLVLGFMMLHNMLDLLRKMLSGVVVDPAEDHTMRLTPQERFQHAVLMFSFCLLAYSGFALKFADAGWAKALAPFNELTRRAIHRWSAAVFTVLAVYHAIYLFVTPRGRIVLRALLPAWHDAVALGQQFAYALGFRKHPPESRGMYHYPEKIEYWSLVWGSFIMIFTGGLLVFNNFTLKHFPAWMADLATLIHYYEAILACLAILIWHGYLVIFDPKVYPMNWAWLTGFIRRKKRQ